MASDLTPPIGVLWDMDGVLVDTGDLHHAAWLEILSDYGLEFPRPQFDATFGMNNMDILTMLFGRAPEPALYSLINERKERRMREMAEGRIQPMPGVLNWLNQLQEAGARQAIASSAPPENITALIDAMKIRSYFAAIVSGIDMPGKPEPHVYLEAARQIDVPPGRCVVIEDAVPGVEGANRAGMKCIAVTTTNSAHALSAATLVAPGLSDLSPAAVFHLLETSPNTGKQDRRLF